MNFQGCFTSLTLPVTAVKMNPLCHTRERYALQSNGKIKLNKSRRQMTNGEWEHWPVHQSGAVTTRGPYKIYTECVVVVSVCRDKSNTPSPPPGESSCMTDSQCSSHLTVANSGSWSATVLLLVLLYVSGDRSGGGCSLLWQVIWVIHLEIWAPYLEKTRSACDAHTFKRTLTTES